MTDTETRLAELRATWMPEGPYEVYENYEGGIEILDSLNRSSWWNINAYDTKEEKERIAQAIVTAVNNFGWLLSQIEALQQAQTTKPTE